MLNDYHIMSAPVFEDRDKKKFVGILDLVDLYRLPLLLLLLLLFLPPLLLPPFTCSSSIAPPFP